MSNHIQSSSLCDSGELYSTVLTMLLESSVLECFALAKHFGKLIPVRLIPTSPPSLLKLPGQ